LVKKLIFRGVIYYLFRAPESKDMDSQLAVGRRKLTTAKLLLSFSERTSFRKGELRLTEGELDFIYSRHILPFPDNMPMLLATILGMLKKRCEWNKSTACKFRIGGQTESDYDLRTYDPNFGKDKINAENVIDRIRKLLEDPTTYGFTTHIETIMCKDVFHIYQQTLVIDWTNPK
jgi:hypothetical protein